MEKNSHFWTGCNNRTKDAIVVSTPAVITTNLVA